MKTTTPREASVPNLPGILRLAFLAITLATPLAAHAQAMFDDFESYPAGASIHGRGGWEGWLGNAPAAGIVSTAQASSGIKSLRVIKGNDTVRPFSGVDSGRWTLSVQQYVPSSAAGATWTILLNSYPADLNWSVQVLADLNQGLIGVFDGQGDQHGVTLVLAKDRWVDLRFEVGLDANSVTTFYDNIPLGTHAWQSGGLNELQALDLYPDEGPTTGQTGAVYYDNVRLEFVGSPPVITQQPQSQTANPGDTVSFTVTASGSEPLTYQWHFNGAVVAGAIETALNLSPIRLTDAGTYAVVVANPHGAVTSTPAILSVTHDFHVWLKNAADIPGVQDAIGLRGGQVIESSAFFERITFRSDTVVFAEIAVLPQVRRAEADLEAATFNFNSRISSGTINVQPPPWGFAPPLSGLTGSGVVAGVWDGGTVGLTHTDYFARLSVMETCLPSFNNDVHAAHVIGTLAGDGSQSVNGSALAGMAPRASIKAWSFLFYNIGGWIAATPQTEMFNARTLPAPWPAPAIDLSQNSWGFVPGTTLSSPCAVYGAYLGFCADYDRLVRQQDLPVFFAAGNAQSGNQFVGGAGFTGPNCVAGGFGTVLPIGTAKNVVTVGAIDFHWHPIGGKKPA